MNVLRVQCLAGFGLEVPDVEVARAFYGSFGLAAADETAGVLGLSSRRAVSAEILLLPGRHKRLHHLSFGVHAADLPRFEEHLRGLGVAPSSPTFSRIRAGLWFEDPWGTWVNLTPAAYRPPPSAEPPTMEPRIDRHLWRELEQQVRPNRLGHMLIFTPDWQKAERFYSDALGLRTTDRAVGKVAFMAAGSGVRDHHCFGLIHGSHRGFQHASFHVDGIDQIGFGALQMKHAGFSEGFGPGRHAIASNLFYYARDPWGSWIEYYADMDKVSEDWKAQDWNDLPYVWPEWAPEFWSREMNANLEPR